MDLFHGNPMLAGVRQMLGAFARQSMRPIAAKHDRDESMPWDLMKMAAPFLSQTAALDGRKKLTGEDDDPDPSKPKSQARIAVVASEEMAWGCAGISLALYPHRHVEIDLFAPGHRVRLERQRRDNGFGGRRVEQVSVERE